MSAPVSPFKAISDDTRRQILDLLHERDRLTAGSIARSFPHISRPAVSKHLAILRQADLVQTRRTGRKWIYSINPGPLRQVADWLSRYEKLWDQQLESFKDYVESTGEKGGESG